MAFGTFSSAQHLLLSDLQAGPEGAPIAQYLASLQEPETGIDVVRDGWLRQMADTERLLAAYEMSSSNAAPSLQPV